MNFKQHDVLLWIYMCYLILVETKNDSCNTIKIFQLSLAMSINIQCRKFINKRWSCLKKITRTNTHSRTLLSSFKWLFSKVSCFSQAHFKICLWYFFLREWFTFQSCNSFSRENLSTYCFISYFFLRNIFTIFLKLAKGYVWSFERLHIDFAWAKCNRLRLILER